jgi:hypothetical protein
MLPRMSNMGAMGRVLFAVGLAGCASYPAPTDKLANTTASVRAAEEVGATKSPQAALHLKLAQEQLDQAKALIKDGDNRRAEFVLMRADADASLAAALARETSMRAEAEKAKEDVRALKKGQ